MTVLHTLVPRTREEYVREIAGYPAQPEANRRAFERDKEILRGMGVPITMETIGDGTEVGYRVRPDDYCLPDLGLSPDEMRAFEDFMLSVIADRGMTITPPRGTIVNGYSPFWWSQPRNFRISIVRRRVSSSSMLRRIITLSAMNSSTPKRATGP